MIHAILVIILKQIVLVQVVVAMTKMLISNEIKIINWLLKNYNLVSLINQYQIYQHLIIRLKTININHDIHFLLKLI